HVKIRRCSPDLNARLHSPDNLQCSLTRICFPGRPKADIIEIKSRRHDPDQHSWLTIQNEDFSQNCRVTVEFGAPKSIVHYEYRRRTAIRIFGQKRSTQPWRHAVKLKAVVGQICDARQSASTARIAIQNAARPLVSHHVLEDMVLHFEFTELIGCEKISSG